MKALAIIKTDDFFMRLAARCQASFDYFHPGIDSMIVRSERWYNALEAMGLLPRNELKLSRIAGLFIAWSEMVLEDYELVICLDADTVVTGRLDEMLEGDYDIAVSNSVLPGYYNSGVWAATSPEFVKEFFDVNRASNMRENNIFHGTAEVYRRQGKRIKVLDDAGVWYNEGSRKWWNRLMVQDDRLFTEDADDPRQVKILHWAGGASAEDKLACSLFPQDVKLWLNKITDTTDFTDNDGEAFGQFLIDYYRLGDQHDRADHARDNKDVTAGV